MAPSDRRILFVAMLLLMAAVFAAVLGSCRGPDVFGVGAGVGRGDGGISGPLSAGGPPGPKGATSGDWDTDSEAWNIGAWVTWDLNPRKVEIVNIPPPSWRADAYVPIPEPPRGPESDPEPTHLPEEPPAGEVPENASEALQEPVVTGATGGKVPLALGGAGILVLLVQYWPQILVGVVKVFRRSPPEVSS